MKPYLRVKLDQRVPQGPGWFGQVRSILETIKIQPRSKIDTTTMQDVNEMQEIDQIRKVKKVRHFFR